MQVTVHMHVSFLRIIHVLFCNLAISAYSLLISRGLRGVGTGADPGGGGGGLGV